jgi:hypothetical protein
VRMVDGKADYWAATMAAERVVWMAVKKVV